MKDRRKRRLFRLALILQECLAYKPDLFILRTRHNAFLVDRSYSNLKSLPAYLVWSLETLSMTRTLNLAREELALKDLRIWFTGSIGWSVG
ncbi:MAG TPA: hypothetical protein EYQ50_23165 [Verrucomicrobiales bacterium]|nr:hypothetical protein [Verrucomicrobiales bacterium]HIL69603.1 hypothetical protein [Verrucomicrobiota bacterium]